MLGPAFIEEIRQGVECVGMFHGADREEWLSRADSCIRCDLRDEMRAFIRCKNDPRLQQQILFTARRIIEKWLPQSIIRCVFVDDAKTENPLIHISIPRYTHDCDLCQFLGVFGDHDLYTCNKAGYRTFIARHGDEGPDYTSGPGPFVQELAEAMRRYHLVTANR